MGLTEQLQGKRVYFDSNIIIYLVEGFAEYAAALDELRELLETDACEAITSELALCEVLVKPFQISTPETITVYQSFLEQSGVFSLVPTTRAIYLHSAFIAGSQAMKIPDAIHVASAQAAGCEVFFD